MKPKSKDGKSSPERLEKLSLAGCHVAIVASRFNATVVNRLLAGALEVIEGAGGKPEDVEIVHVPGAFELPLAARRLAESGEYQAVIALGCVIRGETPHFDYVSRAASDGLLRVSLDSGVPIGFGVLTTETVEQATERSGGAAGNRGADAAAAAIEMIHVLRSADGN